MSVLAKVTGFMIWKFMIAGSFSLGLERGSYRSCKKGDLGAEAEIMDVLSLTECSYFLLFELKV